MPFCGKKEEKHFGDLYLLEKFYVPSPPNRPVLSMIIDQSKFKMLRITTPPCSTFSVGPAPSMNSLNAPADSGSFLFDLVALAYGRGETRQMRLPSLPTFKHRRCCPTTTLGLRALFLLFFPLRLPVLRCPIASSASLTLSCAFVLQLQVHSE